MNNPEYAIKYSKIKIDDKLYFLLPLNIIEGYQVGSDFYSTEIYHTFSTNDEMITVDKIITLEDLRTKYDYPEGDPDFLLNYYFEEEKEKIIIVNTNEDKIKKREINKHLLTSSNLVHSFEIVGDEPIISLNNDSLAEILATPDVKQMRQKLLIMKSQLAKFAKQNATYGTTRILVKDGKIIEMLDDGQININLNQTQTSSSEKLPHDISKKGLVKYLKERIYGHDKELEIIATTLSRNLKPQAIREDIESILVIGPTGSGKTATFEAVASYLNIPFRSINTPSLVPEGIVGKTIEDYINSLIEECHGDVTKAQRSLILFDELDKIAKEDLSVKKEVISELYKFMEGAPLNIKKGSNYLNSKMLTFDTGLTSRVYSGVFEEAYQTPKEIGFNSQTRQAPTFNFANLYNNTVFTKELLDRITYKLLYTELSREDQKKALMSKIGIIYKKQSMLKRLYNVELELESDFIESFLDYIAEDNHSMRDLNNLISQIVMSAENVISDDEGKYSKLILNNESITNPNGYRLY